MEKVLIGIILGILLIGIGFVVAQENITCSSDADCGTASTSFTFCKNETHICTTTTTPTCNNATTNISSCRDVRKDTCWVCEDGCENRACLAAEVCDSDNLNLCLNETSCESARGEWKNATCVKKEVDYELQRCLSIVNIIECNAVKNCKYNNATGKCEKAIKIKKLKEAVMNYLNSTECPENCTCAGNTIKCETENGRVMTVIAGKSGNIIIQTKGINATTSVILIKNASGTWGNFSGKIKRIKYMPDEIKERALKKLKIETCTNCDMTLNEDGNYVMNINGTYRVLWIFPKKAIVVTKVNSETGEVTVLKKPWWKFRAE